MSGVTSLTFDRVVGAAGVNMAVEVLSGWYHSATGDHARVDLYPADDGTWRVQGLVIRPTWGNEMILPFVARPGRNGVVHGEGRTIGSGGGHTIYLDFAPTLGSATLTVPSAERRGGYDYWDIDVR